MLAENRKVYTIMGAVKTVHDLLFLNYLKRVTMDNPAQCSTMFTNFMMAITSALVFASFGLLLNIISKDDSIWWVINLTTLAFIMNTLMSRSQKTQPTPINPNIIPKKPGDNDSNKS